MVDNVSKYVNGREVPDPTPIALPVDFKRPPPLGERIRELVRGEILRRAAEQSGAETFEEADDFDIPDDPIDPATPYEDSFEPAVPGLVARQQEIRAGAVEDIPEPRKEKARQVLSKHRGKKADEKPAADQEKPEKAK